MENYNIFIPRKSYSAKQWNELLIHKNMDESQKPYVEREKPDMKEQLVY